MTEKTELISVCPFQKCGKVIFRNGEVNLSTDKPEILSFKTRCPHCKEMVKITMGVKIKTEPIWGADLPANG